MEKTIKKGIMKKEITTYHCDLCEKEIPEQKEQCYKNKVLDEFDFMFATIMNIKHSIERREKIKSFIKKIMEEITKEERERIIKIIEKRYNKYIIENTNEGEIKYGALKALLDEI